jgi:hypothetical protein
VALASPPTNFIPPLQRFVLLRPVNSMETDYAISLGLENSGKLRR